MKIQLEIPDAQYARIKYLAQNMDRSVANWSKRVLLTFSTTFLKDAEDLITLINAKEDLDDEVEKLKAKIEALAAPPQASTPPIEGGPSWVGEGK